MNQLRNVKRTPTNPFNWEIANVEAGPQFNTREDAGQEQSLVCPSFDVFQEEALTLLTDYRQRYQAAKALEEVLTALPWLKNF